MTLIDLFLDHLLCACYWVGAIMVGKAPLPTMQATLIKLNSLSKMTCGLESLIRKGSGEIDILASLLAAE